MTHYYLEHPQTGTRVPITETAAQAALKFGMAYQIIAMGTAVVLRVHESVLV